MKEHQSLDGFETLETRLLLDGNLTVNVVNDVLNINGDGLSNAFQVLQFDANEFFVVGKDTAGDKPTTVNGLPQFFFTGVRGFNINLGNGNDFGFFNGDAGQGGLQECTVNKNLVFNGGAGSDNFLAEDCLFRGNVIFNGGNGHDFAQIIDSTANKEVRLNGGNNNDLLATFRSFFRDRVIINGGGGNDQILNGSKTHDLEGSIFRDDLRINIGAGLDELELAGGSKVFDELNINGSDHDEEFAFDNLTLLGEVSINSRGGSDNLVVSNIGSSGVEPVDPIVFDLGAGHDILEFDEFVGLDPDTFVKILGGDGDDTINILNSKIGGKLTRIEGGKGADKVKVDKSRLTANNSKVAVGIDNDVLEFIDSFFKNLRLADAGGTGADNVKVNGSRIDRLNIATGRGADRITMTDLIITSFAEINSGAGNDVVRFTGRLPAPPASAARLFVKTDLGNDQAILRDLIITSYSLVSIDSGAGNDILNFDNVNWGVNRVIIDGAAGNDRFRLTGNRFRTGSDEIRVRAGEGDDNVRILNSVLNQLEKIIAEMEEGDDILSFDDDTTLGLPPGRRFLGGDGLDIALPPIEGQYFFYEFEIFR